MRQPREHRVELCQGVNAHGPLQLLVFDSLDPRPGPRMKGMRGQSTATRTDVSIATSTAPGCQLVNALFPCGAVIHGRDIDRARVHQQTTPLLEKWVIDRCWFGRPRLSELSLELRDQA